MNPLCPRNLPQHFNGCRCTVSVLGAEVPIDLTPPPFTSTNPAGIPDISKLSTVSKYTGAAVTGNPVLASRLREGDLVMFDGVVGELHAHILYDTGVVEMELDDGTVYAVGANAMLYSPASRQLTSDEARRFDPNRKTPRGFMFEYGIERDSLGAIERHGLTAAPENRIWTVIDRRLNDGRYDTVVVAGEERLGALEDGDAAAYIVTSQPWEHRGVRVDWNDNSWTVTS